MKTRLLIVFLFSSLVVSRAQELFPHVDPASNIPKGVFGVRIFNEGYTEVAQFKSMQSVRFMLGLNSKWMLTQSFNFSNHHVRTFPSDFIDNDGTLGYHTHGVKKGNKYPYQLSNLNFNIKYRFLSIDGEKEHFRMAAYVEMATGNQAHDEAEPSLMGDNSGVGFGLIATRLYKKYSISGSLGGILPQKYYFQENDSSMNVMYGNALTYSLSTGMLCLPIKYKDYKQTNVNLYAEFIGKAYQGAFILNNEKETDVSDVPALNKGNYVDFRPSVQFIFQSNLRVDLSMGTRLLGRSHVRSYPVYYFTIQRYFYFK